MPFAFHLGDKGSCVASLPVLRPCPPSVLLSPNHGLRGVGPFLEWSCGLNEVPIRMNKRELTGSLWLGIWARTPGASIPPQNVTYLDVR